MDGKAVVVSANGHYLASAPNAAEQLVYYVVQTAAGQELLSPKQFAEKYGSLGC